MYPLNIAEIAFEILQYLDPEQLRCFTVNKYLYTLCSPGNDYFWKIYSHSKYSLLVRFRPLFNSWKEFYYQTRDAATYVIQYDEECYLFGSIDDAMYAYRAYLGLGTKKLTVNSFVGHGNLHLFLMYSGITINHSVDNAHILLKTNCDGTFIAKDLDQYPKLTRNEIFVVMPLCNGYHTTISGLAVIRKYATKSLDIYLQKFIGIYPQLFHNTYEIITLSPNCVNIHEYYTIRGGRSMLTDYRKVRYSH